MKSTKTFGSSLAGALAVSAFHETIRRFTPKAPRMDLLGMQAITALLNKGGLKQPSKGKLFAYALAGDIVSNAIYYSLSSSKKPKNVWVKGAVLGTAAGLGAIMLPKPLGLKEEYSNRTTQTKLITFGLYLAGGLITAALMSRKK